MEGGGRIGNYTATDLTRGHLLLGCWLPSNPPGPVGREEWELAFHYLHVGPIVRAIGSEGREESGVLWDDGANPGILGFSPDSALQCGHRVIWSNSSPPWACFPKAQKEKIILSLLASWDVVKFKGRHGKGSPRRIMKL